MGSNRPTTTNGAVQFTQERRIRNAQDSRQEKSAASWADTWPAFSSRHAPSSLRARGHLPLPHFRRGSPQQQLPPIRTSQHFFCLIFNVSSPARHERTPRFYILRPLFIALLRVRAATVSPSSVPSSLLCSIRFASPPSDFLFFSCILQRNWQLESYRLSLSLSIYLHALWCTDACVTCRRVDTWSREHESFMSSSTWWW